MANQFAIRVRGLKELDRAFGRVNKGLRKGLRDTLKDAANDVAIEARSIAGSKQLRQSGDLIDGIRPVRIMGGAAVRSNAIHRGFEYPRRLEFEGRGGGSYGPRATLLPAVIAKRDETSARVRRLLDDVAKTFEAG
jgi:hypothetical protein